MTPLKCTWISHILLSHQTHADEKPADMEQITRVPSAARKPINEVLMACSAPPPSLGYANDKTRRQTKADNEPTPRREGENNMKMNRIGGRFHRQQLHLDLKSRTVNQTRLS